jgi:hypothetical protein
MGRTLAILNDLYEVQPRGKSFAKAVGLSTASIRAEHYLTLYIHNPDPNFPATIRNAQVKTTA